MMEKKLVVKHEYCIHCWVCVMQWYCFVKEGQKYIKADLSKEKWSEAEMNCPVWAIQQVEEESEE